LPNIVDTYFDDSAQTIFSFQLTCIEQDREIVGLEKTLEKLERVRQVQAKKIQAMRKNIDENDKDSGDKRIIAEDTVQALSSELRTTKRLMENATETEREVSSAHFGINWV
jgi:hypothetical protein